MERQTTEGQNARVTATVEGGLTIAADLRVLRKFKPYAAMPDDKSKTGKEDDLRINIHQDYERRDWAKKLGVSEDRLREAVKKAGPMVKDVRQELGK